MCLSGRSCHADYCRLLRHLREDVHLQAEDVITSYPSTAALLPLSVRVKPSSTPR